MGIKCEKKMADQVKHPSHYNQGKIEVLEFIEDQKLNFHLGNVVKYICRAGKKTAGTAIQDLQKSRFYLNREIHLLECEKSGVEPKRPNEM